MIEIRNYRARHITLAIRRWLEVSYGAERVVIHRDSKVDAFGRMPHSTTIGWWYAGTAPEIMADIHREEALRR